MSSMFDKAKDKVADLADEAREKFGRGEEQREGSGERPDESRMSDGVSQHNRGAREQGDQQQ